MASVAVVAFWQSFPPMTQRPKLKFHCLRVLSVHYVDRRKLLIVSFEHVTSIIAHGRNQLPGCSLTRRKALSLTHLAMKNFHSAVKISFILMVVSETHKSHFFFFNCILSICS